MTDTFEPTRKIKIDTAIRGGAQTHELWLPENPTIDDVQPIIDALHKLVADELVNHPSYYNSHASGIEAIEFLEHMPFNAGTAAKYVHRHAHKGTAVLDLRKARWYIEREINRSGDKISPSVIDTLRAHADSDAATRAIVLLIDGHLLDAKRAVADLERALIRR